MLISDDLEECMAFLLHCLVSYSYGPDEYNSDKCIRDRERRTETDRQRYKQTDMQTDHIICICINDHVHVKSLVDYGNAKIT